MKSRITINGEQHTLYPLTTSGKHRMPDNLYDQLYNALSQCCGNGDVIEQTENGDMTLLMQIDLEGVMYAAKYSYNNNEGIYDAQFYGTF